MIKQFIASAMLLFSSIAFSQNNNAFFLSNPCLTPDGQTVIFSFEGDLWRANTSDGQAVRLTGMDGYESNARVSPDGKWIAFTGTQYGNPDIFVMPVNGGDVKQLTYFSGNDVTTSWSWDSRFIYFNSNRMNTLSGYKVSVEGGTATKVFGSNFFQYDHNLIEHPNGELFFNDTWESSLQEQRKRYKGPFNPDIQSYDLKTKKYKRYTDWVGKDFNASIDRNGNIYYISDEVNGEYNLYTFDNGKKKGLTKFQTSIKSPAVNANGGRVVFEKDYQLWLFDVKSGKADKLAIHIVRNNVLPQEKDFDVNSELAYFDVSPDGKKLAFVSRGELFVSDVEGKFVQLIKRNTTERAKEVKWLADNKTLLFSQTLYGYSNLYTIGADGKSALKKLTDDKQNDRAIIFDKARSKAVYLSGRSEVRILDLKSMESKTVVKDEIWGFQYSDPSFSPEGDYVAFTAMRNFEQDIFIHQLKDGKTFNLTNTGITETSPFWSPDGKYIYFASQRLRPAYPFGLASAHIYRLPLEKLDEPYRIDKFNELFKEEKKDTSKKAATAEKKPIVIDTDHIMERLQAVGPTFGGQNLQYIYSKTDKTSILFNSSHGEGRMALWKTTIEPFEVNKTEKIAGSDGYFDAQIVEVSDKIYALMSGDLFKVNLDANKVDAINVKYTFRRNLSGEFNQMFEEAWSQMEENYYDEKFHGLDWNKTREYYRAFIPYLNNRNDLRVLLNDMLGELNSSHQGFSSFGGEEATNLANSTMETGILFENESPERVKYVVRRTASDKKDVDVRPGDVLVKVNDVAVSEKMDRYYYFTAPSQDREMKLTFERGGQTIEVKVHPQSSIVNNLYDEWIENNQTSVDRLSKGRIAYGYMKNMGQGELEQFIIDMTQELNGKDGLILDLRYNTGGNVHDEVLKFLAQRTYLQWKYREGKLSPQPNFAPSDKPIVLLINEQSLSDAEMTAEGFKTLKLGKIIGNSTYRWIIFTSGVGLVDGSFVRMPGWGCYTLDGKDMETTGVDPDIKVINSFEDRLEGRDPQLAKAVSEILGGK